MIASISSDSIDHSIAGIALAHFRIELFRRTQFRYRQHDYILSLSICYTVIEYKACQAPGDGKFGSGDGAFRKDGTAEAEEFCRTSAGVLAGFASFLDEFLLLDQAAEIRLVHLPSRQRLNTALQLQQRECVRHQFKYDRMVFDLGPKSWQFRWPESGDGPRSWGDPARSTKPHGSTWMLRISARRLRDQSRLI